MVPCGERPARARIVSKDLRKVPHSSHWGAFDALVSEGRLAGVLPHRLDPHPSQLLESIPDALTAKCRIERPAIRRGWLEKGAGRRGPLRGADDFVEVPWDSALKFVAEELSRVRTEHGNAAIFGGSYGWSSAGRFHHAKTQLARFLNCFGGYTDQVHNYSFAAALALLPHIVGTSSVVNGEVTSWSGLVGATKLWLMFGGMPLKNTQVEAGGISAHRTREWLLRMRDAGTQFVCISPVRDDTPDELGAEWVSIRPTTDTALMLGLAHTLVAEGLHDRGFLDRYCEGYDRFEAYLLGRTDDVPKTAEWASGVTGVSAETIRMLARSGAASRTFLSATWSLQRAEHGEQPYWMLIVLAAMLGQIGLPGGGFGFGYGNTAGIGNPKLPFPAPALPTGSNPTGSWIPVARIADMLLDPHAEYEFNGETRVYPDIRLVYWAGGNPFHHHQDLNRLREAWQRPETIIVHESWWTATARHADIVLPATTTLERNDIGASGRDSYLIAMKKAVEPLGEARSDYEIFRELARALGFEEDFTEGRDEIAWVAHLYERVRRDATAADLPIPPFTDFWEQGEVKFDFAPTKVLFDDFRKDPEVHPLATSSGRIEIFSATIDGFGYDDCPGHPVWLPPREWAGSPVASRYPLHLVSRMPSTRLHGQLDMGRVSQASKVKGREPCLIHSQDAGLRGIRDGQIVRVFNERGSCLAGAVLTEAIRPGVLVLANGAWFDPMNPESVGGLDAHGNPNVLTADLGTSRLGQGPSAHSTLVEVEIFVGTPPPIKAFDPPSLTRSSKELRK